MSTVTELHRDLCRLVLFRPRDDAPLFQLTQGLAQTADGRPSCQTLRQLSLALRQITEQLNRLSFRGNFWHGCLTWFLLTDENPFSLSRERAADRQDGLDRLAARELEIFWRLFRLELAPLGKALGLELLCRPELDGPDSPNTGGAVLTQMARQLAGAPDGDAFYQALVQHYQRWGAGLYGVSHAFRVAEKEPLSLLPLYCPDPVRLDDLVGYEEQKSQLLRNTQAFLEGKPANNVLLYGDSGAGKSTCVRGILQEFAGQGLRLVELYKHQFRSLADLLALVKGRGCKFLLFIDDLSFEEFEVEYKALKALIEGGLESRPDNLLIYATSNRRHLIRETWNDRSDMEHSGELHRSDTLEEKLSLAGRFGLAIHFPSPTHKEYHQMVKILARRAGIQMEEALLLRRADAWEIRHGGISGRAAQQFINDLVCGAQK